MTREEALDYMHEHSWEFANENWGRDKSGKGWICPICGSGSGEGKHGAGTGLSVRPDGTHFTCWAGCFTNADVIDIIGIVERIPEGDHTAKFEAARRAFGLSVDEPARPRGTGRKSTAAEDFKSLGDSDGETQGAQTERPAAPAPDGGEAGSLDTFFLEANKHLPELVKGGFYRGISLETLNRFYIGYVKDWTDGKIFTPSPRLILPSNGLQGDVYKARWLGGDDHIPKWTSKYSKHGRGKYVFNREALQTTHGPVFICEGELDCLSFIEVGAEAITGGSVSDWDVAANAIKANPPAYPVIVAFDEDEAGKMNGDRLKRALGAAKISFTVYSLPEGAKDANEALIADRAAFEASVKVAIQDAMSLGEREPGTFPSLSVPQDGSAGEPKPINEESYIEKQSASASLQSIIERIKVGEQIPPISTGFETLDRILQGGLRAGLYVLGAVQSLGKTAFVGQIWDSVAAAGHDVLIFSLEMAREELITRSISRITYELSKKAVAPGRMAYSTIELLSGSCYGKDGAAGNRRIMDAVEAYSKYSDRIFILEGVGDITVEQMREAVKKHIQLTGRRPVVVCDYLQIVKAEPDEAGRRGTDKQANDDNIVALKHLSRDAGIPVVVISSFNRQNYTEPLNPGAFKESGSIEYSADCLIGLQYRGMEYRAGDEKEGQRARRVAALIKRWERFGKEGKSQGIHVKVMKNRAGYKDGAYFSYYPAFNYFACDTDADVEEQKKDEEWARVVEDEGKTSRKNWGTIH